MSTKFNDTLQLLRDKVKDWADESWFNTTLAELEILQHNAEKEVNKWKSDVATINDFLNNQADERDFCSEYEDFIQEINEALSVATLAGRSFSFSVEVDAEITFRQTVFVSVEASSASEAEEMVQEDYCRYVLPLLPMLDASEADDIDFTTDEVVRED